MRDPLVARGGLESMGERVAEIEDRPLAAALVRVAEADRRLVRDRPANERLVSKLPERLAREQTGFDDLCHALEPLLLGERLEQRRVDHRPRRPVERADEVL